MTTYAIFATGPSLNREDCERVRAAGWKTIGVNDAYRLAPWCDHLYGADWAWWHAHDGVPNFQGQRWSVSSKAQQLFPNIRGLQPVRAGGINFEAGRINVGLRRGANSGHQAINLAVHLGARRVVLLGYDMRGEHFFGQHQAPLSQAQNFPMWIRSIATILPKLADGTQIVNATPGSALGGLFPLTTLDDELRRT